MEPLQAVTVMSCRESAAVPQHDLEKRTRLANALLLTDFSPSSELRSCDRVLVQLRALDLRHHRKTWHPQSWQM
jgi:hypothetical protein